MLDQTESSDLNVDVDMGVTMEETVLSNRRFYK